jgi:hypothetical protein
MSHATHNVNKDCCATCIYWEGPREVKFNRNKPWYVKAASGSYKCQAYPNRQTSSVTRCQRFSPWPSIQR